MTVWFSRLRLAFWPTFFAVLGLIAALAVGCGPHSDPPPSVAPPPTPNDIDKQVRCACSTCHLFPDDFPQTFPRSAWREEVEQAYRFAASANIATPMPPMDATIAWFEQRAPEKLPDPIFEKSNTPLPIKLQRTSCPAMPLDAGTAVSNVNLVHLSDENKLDVLTCEMRTGRVLLYKPYEEKPTWQVLAKQPHPAHAEVVDLDGDGIKDILVANLGSFSPTDRLAGSVVWLRGKADGTFTPITLLDGVGRVADVQAADFNGDGKLDLIVAAFGWRETGEILYLENQTTDWDHPKFVPHVLDMRHGAIHVPVVVLNGDGKPRFHRPHQPGARNHRRLPQRRPRQLYRKEIFRGPHPAYGSSGIQLVDMNGDGKIDILYTNGDVLDKPYLLKPYHSIQWLENPGDGTFPWKHHPITPLYGVHRAVAADICGHGRMDIIATSFLPKNEFPQREPLKLDSIILLEQTADGQFVRRTVETANCDYVTCAVGDLYGTGRKDLVLGHFDSDKGELISIWKNLGSPSGEKRGGAEK